MKKSKLYLVLIVVFSMAMNGVFAQTWDGVTATIWTQGDGLTQETAYEIATPENLAYLAQQVNAGTGYSGTYFKMINDLNLGSNAWTRIGSSETNSFKGVFDGNNHAILNLLINRTGNNATLDGIVGLFGYVNTGTVRNLGIESGSVQGFTQVGCIAGVLKAGTIENCYNKANVVTARAGGNFGGIVGTLILGTVQYCYNTGNVLEGLNGNNNASGIVGAATSGGTIRYCFNSGLISGNNGVGGIVGSAGSVSVTAQINDCYNIGTIKGKLNFAGVAGLVTNVASVIENCYSTGKIDISLMTGAYGAVFSSTTTTSTTCFYDSKLVTISAPSEKASPLSTVDMLGDGLKLTFGETNWVFATGFYPALKNMNTSDIAILSIAPFILVSDDNVSSVKANFTVETSTGVSWVSSNPTVIAISGNNAIVSRQSTDQGVTLTATYGSVSKVYNLTVLESTTTDVSSKVLPDIRIIQKQKVLELSGNLTIGSELKLFNLSGKLVLTHIIGSSVESIPVTAISEGIYVVTIQGADGVTSYRKIIIQ